MNKRELIKHIEDLPYNEGLIVDTIKISRNGLLKLIEQLDEPEQVTIPQFVADYIDISKFYVRTLHYALENSPERVNLWLCEDEINRQNTFAQAWLDGYEVEEEKRYLVKLKGIEKEKCYLNYNFGRVWLFYNQDNFYGYRAHHTRKELEEAGFGWVFDCEGVEVEEVE